MKNSDVGSEEKYLIDNLCNSFNEQFLQNFTSQRIGSEDFLRFYKLIKILIYPEKKEEKIHLFRGIIKFLKRLRF